MKAIKSVKTIIITMILVFGGVATTSHASTVNLGTLTPFTGGDSGDGLDLSGNIIYAFNLGGIAQTVQGVNFAAASVGALPTGITTTGSLVEYNYIAINPGGANAADYGVTADDDALETMMTSIWGGPNWTFDLTVQYGMVYKLQLILQEGFWNFQGDTKRNFDISVETDSPVTMTLAVDDLVLGQETDGAATAQPGADQGLVYTYTFTAIDTSFRVALDDSLAGIDKNTILNAVTLEELGADATQPTIVFLDPSNGSTTGMELDANLLVSFDEFVAFGTGDITLRTSSGGLVEAFDVTSSPNLSLNGVTVTINPTSDLLAGTNYYVEIAATAIDDKVGNSFAGITNAMTWSFSPDTTPPAIVTLSPANGASDVLPFGGLVVLTFDEEVQKGTGNILIRQISGGTVVDTIDVTSGQVTVSGGQVTITPSATLPLQTGLYVEIAPTAIDDFAGNSFAGISGSGTWSFTTAMIVFYYDFNTDPNIGSDWTEYFYYGTEDNVTTTWNSIEQDLDLVKTSTSAGTGTSVNGLYRIGSWRLATDSVTLTVKDYSQTGGAWGQLGLIISTIPQPNLLDSNTRYEWTVRYSGGSYSLRVRKDTGSGSYDLFDEAITLSGPVKLDIMRVGDDYQFLSNDVLKYTADGTGDDVYDTATKDSLVNYAITFGGDGPVTATVDDFGVPSPSSGTLIMLK